MSSNKTSRKSSINGFNKLKQEIKDLNRWKKKTNKLLSELDSRMDDLNNRVMDELDNKDIVTERLDKVFTDVKKIQRDLDQDNERIDGLIIDIDRHKYKIDVVKYILKQNFSTDFRPYHIDARRPAILDIQSDAVSRSPGRV